MEVAKKRGITAAEVREIIEGTPQQPNPADQELEAAFWFHRTFVADSLKGKCKALMWLHICSPDARTCSFHERLTCCNSISF